MPNLFLYIYNLWHELHIIIKGKTLLSYPNFNFIELQCDIYIKKCNRKLDQLINFFRMIQNI